MIGVSDASMTKPVSIIVKQRSCHNAVMQNVYVSKSITSYFNDKYSCYFIVIQFQMDYICRKYDLNYGFRSIRPSSSHNYALCISFTLFYRCGYTYYRAFNWLWNYAFLYFSFILFTEAVCRWYDCCLTSYSSDFNCCNSSVRYAIVFGLCQASGIFVNGSHANFRNISFINTASVNAFATRPTFESYRRSSACED